MQNNQFYSSILEINNNLKKKNEPKEFSHGAVGQRSSVVSAVAQVTVVAWVISHVYMPQEINSIYTTIKKN